MTTPGKKNSAKGRPRLPYHRVKHGTETGYMWHYNNDNPFCEPCLEAHRKANRDRRKTKRRMRNAYFSILYPKGGASKPSKAEQDEAMRDLLRFVRNYQFVPTKPGEDPNETTSE